jgi:hypothetical protein
MKRIALLLVFASLIACSRKPMVVPDDILAEKEMTELLTDLHLMQSSLNERMKEKPAGTHDDYFELLLRKHKVTRENFLKSLKFYSDHPEVLNEVYDSVIVRLSTKNLN